MTERLKQALNWLEISQSEEIVAGERTHAALSAIALALIELADQANEIKPRPTTRLCTKCGCTYLVHYPEHFCEICQGK